MYFVKYGESYLHDPRSTGTNLFELSVTSDENTCGYCDFTIYPEHPLYSHLKERDLDNPIRVYDDSTLLFSGFIYELGTSFYMDGTVKCKGDLDLLNDTLLEPYTTYEEGTGVLAPSSPSAFFAWMIEKHNSQVDYNKRFVIGINEADELDLNRYIYRENSSYSKIGEEIQEKLLDSSSLGGFLRLRYENNVRYIDYLAEWNDTNSQIFDFGVNLTNYMQTDDSSELATYVIPQGANMNMTDYTYNDGYFQTADVSPVEGKTYYTISEDGYYIEAEDITSFEVGVTYYEYDYRKDESNKKLGVDGLIPGQYEQDGFVISGNRILSESAISRYGMIGMVYRNTDLTLKESLYLKGILALKEKISPKRTIEIKAVDMHLINPSMKPIRVGEYVRVRSIPHNLDSYFLCRNIELDLNNPERSVYTLGTTYDTLTGQQNKKINELNATLNQTSLAGAQIQKDASDVREKTKEVTSAVSTVKTAESNVIATATTVQQTAEVVQTNAETAATSASSAGSSATAASTSASSASTSATQAQQYYQNTKDLSDSLRDIIKVSETQPTSPYNQEWVEPDTEEVSVCTLDEFDALIEISDTQPTNQYNKQWIEETTQEVIVPTKEDLQRKTISCGNATLEVSGNVCILQMNNVQMSASQKIIPEAYRPKIQVWSAISDETTGSRTQLDRVTVETDGTVVIQINGGNESAMVRGQIMWII